MSIEDRSTSLPPLRRAGGRGRRRRPSLTAGGTDGNEQLTAITGVALIVLLAVIGVTILRIGQLVWVHLFVGLLLLGPVVLKMASTGYRLARYYTGSRAYREKGPPHAVLRAIAPGLVATTIAVFVSGLILLFDGPANRGSMVGIHKVSFIVWLVFAAAHVLGHLPGLSGSFSGTASLTDGHGVQGTAGRWLAVGGALVAGLVVAVALIPHYSAWTAAGAFPHHHD